MRRQHQPTGRPCVGRHRGPSSSAGPIEALSRPGPRPRSPHRTDGERGVALIESLVAILVLSFGLIGLLGLQARAAQVAATADDTNRAALLVDEMAADMWLDGGVGALDLDAWKKRCADPQQGGFSGAELKVTVDGDRARVELTWPSREGQRRYVTEIVP